MVNVLDRPCSYSELIMLPTLVLQQGFQIGQGADTKRVFSACNDIQKKAACLTYAVHDLLIKPLYDVKLKAHIYQFRCHKLYLENGLYE